MNGFLRAIAPPAVGLALVVLAAACPPKIPPFDPGTVRADKLPRHVPTLLKFARKRLARGRAQGGFHRLYFADAVIALDKARGLAPKHREVLLLGAQTSRALGERARTGPEQFKYAELGLTFTRAGRQHFGKQAVFHYYHAALLGLRVDAYRASAFSGVPEIRKAAERAIALDRRVDSAGPLRVLGSLLASVPATAPFHGDVEKGTALLEQAVKLSPDHPLNHYFLAQAYAKDDETAQATRHYHRVLCTQIGGTWDKVLATKYRARTIKALRELKQSTAPKCP